ncbi:MAG: hypothetical protein AB7O97_09025 [Planctomycetota bacterium]
MDVLSAAFGLLAQTLAAWLLVRAALGRGDPLLRAGASWLLFAALTSSTAFVGMASGLTANGLDALLPAIALVAAIAVAHRVPPAAPATAPPDDDAPPLPPGLVTAAMRLGLGLAVTGAAVYTLHCTEGDVDAWAMWNTKAALLAGRGADWPATAALLQDHYHPDYPLLLPAFHAQWLRMVGGPSVPVQIAIAWAFTLAGLLLLHGLLLRLRGVGWARLGALVLGATPWYWSVGIGQMADVPLGGYALGALGLAALALRQETPPRAHLLLAGAFAAAAAWTKNEGMLFLLALGLAALLPLRALGLARWRRLALPFAAGAAPVLAVTLWFKATIAVDNDLVAAAADGDLAALLLDPARWVAVAAFAFAELSKLGNGLFWVVAAAVLVSRWRAPQLPVRDAGTGWIAITMALWFAGYLLVYVVTPHDLQWHLSTSLRRLLVQLWIPGVLALLLARGAPTPVSARAAPPAAGPAR